MGRFIELGPALRKQTLRSSSGYEIRIVELANGKIRLRIKTPEGKLLLKATINENEAKKFKW